MQKISTLKKIISFFYRLKIATFSSKFNPLLIVYLQDGKLVLNTKNANYSFGSLHRVFQKAFYKINITKNPPKNILLLGLGAGSVPQIIYNQLNLNPNIDAVEIDPKVVDLGKKYFGLNDYKKLSIFIDDAKHFVEISKNHYDLIIVDLFNDISVPEDFCKLNFFQSLNRLLDRNGQILFNFVAYDYQTSQKSENIKEVFPFVTVYKIENINRVFYIKNQNQDLLL